MSGCAVADLAAAGRIREHVLLAPLTTYRFGGPARWFLDPGGEDDLLALAAALAGDGHGHQVLVVGKGSNLVIADDGFDGVVVHVGAAFRGIAVDPGSGDVAAGAASPLPLVARRSVEHDRSGLEFFVGVPGTVGGAVRMNAGCFGADTAGVLAAARVVDLAAAAAAWRPGRSLGLRYRHSDLRPDEVVVAARFATVPGERRAGEDRLREITRWRRTTQPGGTHNAGSVFKNPPGDAAGRLIEAAGLKGFRIGAAAVSRRHGNFFVAGEGATARDVYDLVAEVRRRVGEETGIWLEPEIVFAGDFAAAGEGR